MYDDVCQALVTATSDWVDFRNRRQSYEQLKNMLLALVSNGINLYLDEVVAQHGKEVAEMSLHVLCYTGSTAFAIHGLDGRWMSSQESADRLAPKRAKTEHVIAIKYRPRPKLVTEVRGHGHSSPHASEGAQWYQPHVKRGRDALNCPFGSRSWRDPSKH
jgi:hypothetical protein